MKNTVDLTENRAFKDKQVEHMTPWTTCCPWEEKKKSYDGGDYHIIYDYHQTVPSFHVGNSRIRTSLSQTDGVSTLSIRYNDTEMEHVFYLSGDDGWLDYIPKNSFSKKDYNYEESTTFMGHQTVYAKLRNDEDLHSARILKSKEKEIPNLHRIPWESVPRSFCDHTSSLTRMHMRMMALSGMFSKVPWLKNKWETKQDFHKIPWKHVSGEKNPLNTWDLPDDFEDAEIEMPSDSFFLRPASEQHSWQLGIN